LVAVGRASGPEIVAVRR